MAGVIYLIPVTLGNDNFKTVIPADVISLTCSLRHFIVEEIRSARRYLRLLDKNFPIDESVFFELNEHTDKKDMEQYLEPLFKGENMGLMSEAGLPGIADPGSGVVEIAHRKNIRVVPLSGPSSIILALVASGLNGQSFAFNGYLPVKPIEASGKIKELEKRSMTGQTQIFMEAPYRNTRLLETILNSCSSETFLCIATDITLPSESIITRKIADWKNKVPDINKKPTIFLLQG